MGDVNGDGKADLVAVNDGSTWVMLSTGSGFGAPTQWSSTPFFGTKATLVGDVNGDGKADLIAVNDGSTWVMLSTALAVKQTLGVANTSTGTSLMLSGITATTTGNLLVADIVMRTSAVPSTAVATFTDNQSNTWHKAVANNPAGIQTSGEIWYSFNATGGVTSVTATVGASSGIIIRFYEVSGALTTDPLDKTVTATNSSTAVNSGATGTTSQANEIAIASVGFALNTVTISGLSAGYTTNPTIVNNTTSPDNEQNGYQVASAPRTFFFAGTLSASAAWVASIATFR